MILTYFNNDLQNYYTGSVWSSLDWKNQTRGHVFYMSLNGPVVVLFNLRW